MSNSILDNSETLIGMAEIGRRYATHPATVARWCHTGCRARDGCRIRLEHVRVGAKMKSSAEALTRFFSALTGETPAVEVAPQTPNERRKAAEAADQELAKMLG